MYNNGFNSFDLLKTLIDSEISLLNNKEMNVEAFKLNSIFLLEAIKNINIQSFISDKFISNKDKTLTIIDNNFNFYNYNRIYLLNMYRLIYPNNSYLFEREDIEDLIPAHLAEILIYFEIEKFKNVPLIENNISYFSELYEKASFILEYFIIERS